MSEQQQAHSIFSEYYQSTQFVDRFAMDGTHAVDVIIPIIHTNEMWRANLASIYREVPVNRLILGDGGCIDGSVDIAREFPRVEVLDHRNFVSLGFSLRHLIEAATTEWFVYLHSDVYLPPGWFDSMCAHRTRFDWFECNQRITVMADYLLDTTKIPRAYSGSQMGRKSAFEKVATLIDDDYLYRNEDIIIAKLVERAGYRYGKVGETHHFHQIMYKPSRWHRAVKRVAIELDLGRDEDIRANRTYAQGMVKYLAPAEVTPDLKESIGQAVQRLVELGDTSEAEFLAWVREANPDWLPVLSPPPPPPLQPPPPPLLPLATEPRRPPAHSAQHAHPLAVLQPRAREFVRATSSRVGAFARTVLNGGASGVAPPFNSLLELVGLRVLRSASFVRLLDALKSMESIAAAQNSQLQALASQHAQTLAANARQDELIADLNVQLDQSRMTAYRLRTLELASRQQIRELEERIGDALNRPNCGDRASSLQNRKPDVVIAVTTVSQMPQLRAFASAAAIRDAYRLTVVAYFDVAVSDLQEFCVKQDILLLNYKGDVLHDSGDFAELLEGVQVQPYFGAGVSLGDYQADERLVLETANTLLAEVHWQNGLAMLVHRLFRLVGASAVVLFEDCAEYHTGMWVAVARNIGIPVVVLPYAIIDSGDAAEAHYNDPAHSADNSSLNRFVATALPRWIFHYRERSLLRRSAVGALTSEALGFSQPKPWVWNSTRADVLAVESEAMRDVYLAQGLPAEQIEITGSASDDILHDALVNADRVRQELGLDPKLRTIVCGFPPNQFSIGRPEPEFPDFHTIVDRWLGELARLEGWQVVVKPHPAMHESDIEYLRTFRFPVTKLDTASLIPICDIFSTSISSTIRWALACGKPVINYDVYRYRYQDFVNEPAVLTLFDFDDFSRELHRLTGDRAELQKLTEVARSSSARWGTLDGGSVYRIVKLLDRLTGR